MEFKSPWKRHSEAQHETEVSRMSPDGFTIVLECATCNLSWLMPTEINGYQYPITVHRYPYLITEKQLQEEVRRCRNNVI